ncbi:MAG: S-layer homology domain-containing protein [Oscillibacter sp.]|nr:S-layer homology domain-containing protein [Oscillibacter sp.]
MKRLTFLFALFLCLCVFAGASEAETTWETEAEEGDLILPPLADIGFPDAPDADKPRVIKAEEFESADNGVLVTNETPAAINAQDIAQEKEGAAQALYALGLFRGTSTTPDGKPVFDLDSVPTRNQAVIMLVRLLGKEQEALSGKWEIPFKDVPSGSTTAPYIGYAYANGLTKGTSETTYSGTNPVTRNQYLLFLMRAMGYANHASYSNGMSTADAEFVADKLGLLDGTDAGRFTRGDVALISNRALDAYMCFNKPDLQTLREALNLGASLKFPDRFKTFSVDASYRQYADMAEIEKNYIQKDSGTGIVKEEISVPGGKIIHFVFAGTPHGSVEKLIHALDDGKVYDLPLPGLNTWGMCAEPQNLSYDAETGKLTYEAEIPQDLEWWRYFTLRRAGTYQYTYRPAERAGSVALVSLSATYDANPPQS